MHIPGQGFGHVQIKADRDSRTRFTDLQCQNFKGWISWSQKGTTENYIVILPFPWDIVCMLSLFALRGALLFFKPLPLRGIGGDGHKMLRESRGDHRRLSLLTIFLHVRVTRTGIASGNCVQQSNVRHYMRPFAYCQTQSTSCTLFSKKKILL